MSQIYANFFNQLIIYPILIEQMTALFWTLNMQFELLDGGGF